MMPNTEHSKPDRLRRLAARFLYGNAPYAWTLGMRPPADLVATPMQPWSGDSARGAQILKGNVEFNGESHPADAALWETADAGERWQAALHSFTWLADLHAVGSDPARRRGREMMAEWIRRHPGWSELAWRTDILAARVIAWIAEHDFFCASADDSFREAYLLSLSRQVRHLTRIAPGSQRGVQRLILIKAVIYGAVALPDSTARLERAMALLEQELRRQVHPDGGHIERSPASQLIVLRTLVDIRACLTAGRKEIPTTLQGTIDRMAPALRAMRHADGGLAAFNGATGEDAWLVDAVLTQADAPGRAPDELRYTGFQRLRAGRTLIVADMGAPPPDGFDRAAHAGALSFEMDVGKERLVVNCGAHTVNQGGQWTLAQRATAAHSTVTLGDTNSSEIKADGTFGRRIRHVTCAREAVNGAVLVDASHDGYQAPFGMIHRRRLFLSPDGHDLRGEDSLSGRGGCDFAVRFHLHPDVSASLLGKDNAVLLRLPGGGGWRFQVSGGGISLAESVHLGRRGEVRRAEQIEVRGHAVQGDAVVKWAFKRIGEN
ncbi:MAG: heparinase II/III family protein [Alphaproteobacteria bacterium]